MTAALPQSQPLSETSLLSGGWLSRVRRAFAFAGVLVVGVAGGGKLLDLGGFAASLESWTFIPAWSLPVLVVLVPSIEVLLFGSYVAWPRVRTRVAFLSVLLIGGATSLYALQLLLMGDPPSCNCFGRLGRYHAAQDRAAFVLARNLVLLLVIGQSVLLGPRPSGEDS